MEYLERKKVAREKITFRIVLNNTTSTRPKSIGGKTCESLASCMKTDVKLLTLTLPNSFRASDGLVLEIKVSGNSLAQMEHTACAAALAVLLLREGIITPKVRLLSLHWIIETREIRLSAASASKCMSSAWASPEVPASGGGGSAPTSTGAQVGPVLPPASPGQASHGTKRHIRDAERSAYVAPPPGFEHLRELEVIALLRKILRFEPSGWAAPSRLRLPGGYQKLNALLVPNGLFPFIAGHSEFQYRFCQGKKWEFGFAFPGPQPLRAPPVLALENAPFLTLQSLRNPEVRRDLVWKMSKVTSEQAREITRAMREELEAIVGQIETVHNGMLFDENTANASCSESDVATDSVVPTSSGQRLQATPTQLICSGETDQDWHMVSDDASRSECVVPASGGEAQQAQQATSSQPLCTCAGIILLKDRAPLGAHDKTQRLWVLLVTSKEGRMGFPKGRQDFGDRSLLDTAKREFAEETNLNPDVLQFIDNEEPVLDLMWNVCYYVAMWFQQIELEPWKVADGDAERDQNPVVRAEWMSIHDALLKPTFSRPKKILLQDAAFKWDSMRDPSSGF